MEGKAAALGDADFVMPFAALGLDTFAVEPEAEGVAQAASEILKRKYGLVVTAENVAGFAADVFESTQKKAAPCVVVVPFTSEPTGVATESLSKMLKIATGIDILAG
ncbi:MAG: V-type ATP synthase subunit F [Planctomycetota bacterium]